MTTIKKTVKTPNQQSKPARKRKQPQQQQPQQILSCVVAEVPEPCVTLADGRGSTARVTAAGGQKKKVNVRQSQVSRFTARTFSRHTTLRSPEKRALCRCQVAVVSGPTSDSARSYVGRHVSKHFPTHHGIFRGEVTSYEAANKLYVLKYDDGDIETMELGGLLRILVPGQVKEPRST